MKLFTKGISNTKTRKSENSDAGYSTLILHLAPAKESGFEMCASRSAGCTAACLYTAGRGRMQPIKNARIKRTLMWVKQREEFKKQIKKELTSFLRQCEKNQTLPAVRMNGTSDIIWEKTWPELFTDFDSIQFYDYTKHKKRCLKGYVLPNNYHLTFSRSESNDDDVLEILRNGKINVAVVFGSRNFPKKWRPNKRFLRKSYPTYSADDHDLRFLDPNGGHIGCLYSKGKAKKDESGFVIYT